MRNFHILLLLYLGCIASFASPAKPDKKMQRLVDESLDFSLRQSLRMFDSVKDLPGEFPNITKDGKFATCKAEYWTAGFFSGELWYLYENTGLEEIRSAAEIMTERVLPEQFDTTTHDLHFLIGCSAGNGFRLTGQEKYRMALINAGRSLSSRFNPLVGCTRSWNSNKKKGRDFVVIADNLMNLELLIVSSALSGNLEQFRMAKSHADVTMKNHFRPDYSSYHLVNYNSSTGEIISRITSQGLSDDSAWARGQAWCLYGYTMMYRQTGEERYLKQACRVADFITGHNNLPKDKIPYWDFDAPKSNDTPRDASAAAVNASALIELSQYCNEEPVSSKYLRFAEATLRSLSSKAYRAKAGENANFILMHSTANKPRNNYDTPWVVADYYYIEALMRYKRLIEGRPVVDVQTAVTDNPDRQFWISMIDRIARPMLSNLANGTLRKRMPVESNAPASYSREGVSHFEGFARTLMGISPWLELGPDSSAEGKLRAEFIDLALKAIAQAVDPGSPDVLHFDNARQCKVDAANFALALLRAPTQLWARLDGVTKTRVIEKLKESRPVESRESNWLNFGATVEAALLVFTGECDMAIIDHLFDRFKNEFYIGDGWYGDGKMFQLDYYNSYVIQPMMMAVLDVLYSKGITVEMDGKDFREIAKARYRRYAAIQERLISPEGTYPLVGRSACYRMGAFQGLSDAAFRHILPEDIDPAQVRCALTAVMRRQLCAPGTFDENGWLRPGFCGHQPDLGESYISTGSLYLTSTCFIALGLPESDPFWSNPAADWTSKKAWEGVNLARDKALKDAVALPVDVTRSSGKGIKDKKDSCPQGAVDLGLSVMWATCNLGANSPEGYGNYYAWGETDTKPEYTWANYKWCRGTYDTLTKYNTNNSYGTVDNITSLRDYDYADDAAHALLGENWRIPTSAEFKELVNNCISEWTSINGIYGRKFTSKIPGYTDKWIFLPAAGLMDGPSLYSVGAQGGYWSSTLFSGGPYSVYLLGFYSSDVAVGDYYRYRGRTIRPVTE